MAGAAQRAAPAPIFVTQRARQLAELQQQIIASHCCPRLVGYCRKVACEKRAMYRDQEYWGKAVPSFGDPEAELLILGLAPAAHGANRTGRMFTGDRSGDFLFRALYQAGFANQPASVHRHDGLTLRNCYITAAVRWAPPKNKPTPGEIQACLPFLEKELELLTCVRAVLALGSIAFHTFLRLVSKRATLPPRSQMKFGHGLSYPLPSGLPRVFCSYHPSQQNTQTGRLTPQMFQSVVDDICRFLKS